MTSVKHLPEPLLEFGFGQQLEYTRDGLFLYGPVDQAKEVPLIRYGVVGSREGVRRFSQWAESISNYVGTSKSQSARTDAYHVAFPGFQSAFGAQWPTLPAYSIADVDECELNRLLRIGNRYEAVNRAVDVYVDRLVAAVRRLENPPALWFVVIPDFVYEWGRPQSSVPKAQRVPASTTVTISQARRMEREPTLFAEDEKQARIYEFAPDFRRQLKARLLQEKIITQILRESTLTPSEFLRSDGKLKYPPQDPAAVAWRLSTGIYYKAGGRPWQLANVRDGVCYVGLVYKRNGLTNDTRQACCAAQMFLSNGDGVVFRGAIGPWYQEDRRQFHLDFRAAKNLIDMVVAEYLHEYGSMPRELFIHAKSAFDDQEWRGFQAAAPDRTNLVGVHIVETSGMKLYRPGRYPVIRGTALLTDARAGYLWTAGYVPRLDTYMGSETPNPLWIRVVRGTSHIETVLSDILGLTKLNFNSCVFNDRAPVTIKFANAIGDIVTAAPPINEPRLPFKHYI
jgi:hypothetical protein